MLLGQEDQEVEHLPEEIDMGDQDGEQAIEEVVISMHVTHPNPFMQSIRFKGQLGTNSIFALLDSGSTQIPSLWK
jgi:hypothetical protein